MHLQFVPVEFAAIRAWVEQHLATLGAPIDSFLEDHILASQHYQIEIDGADAGFTSIHQRSLITQFALRPAQRRHSQMVYRAARTLEQVQAAFVPTCDEFFLAHALDDERRLARQAYFFQALPPEHQPARAAGFALRPAAPADSAFIQQHAGDFFGDVARSIQAQQPFMVETADGCVGFGLIVRSALYPAVASIGMYTIEAARRRGVGTATIGLLIDACAARGLQTVAGCWYYNHASKKTLERAGMVSQTRLLKIEY